MKQLINDLVTGDQATDDHDRDQSPTYVEPMLTIEEAARQLGYTPSGLYKLVHRTRTRKAGAKITFFQIGTGPIKFRQEWLDEFVESNSIKPGQQQSKSVSKKSIRRAIQGRPIQIEPQWSLAV